MLPACEIYRPSPPATLPKGARGERSGIALAINPRQFRFVSEDDKILRHNETQRPRPLGSPELRHGPVAMTASSRILIADDNLQNCELLDAYLIGEPYEIAMAHDGQETLNKVAEFQPDLILLDIMMPKLSGYEVCKRLRADKATKDIPILMVTALNELGDIERAVQAGADDFLTKPVHRLELTTRVRSLLRVRHLTNQRDRLLAYLEEVDGEAVKSLGLK